MLAELLTEIERQDEGDGREPLVSLELFFEDNDDHGSIGGNLSEHPGVPAFYATLRRVRDRADVTDVLVGISVVPGGGEWPFSDRVQVVTSAPAGDVHAWVAELVPDSVAQKARAVTVWWG
ncbi:hypothetical protein [Actinoplanes derwentensis]|uniref:Uncharacterized protein n=1 Tax=Actinoplanes derwentensis TaxID=113562 RepID=A0A1H2A0D0_9ACTN|nr:hypothetical protein [Actinoplanes derwentensis]SDT38946.1 hypothetical protein SAMN04489716_3575 [Actinoplanes derwentensis]